MSTSSMIYILDPYLCMYLSIQTPSWIQSPFSLPVDSLVSSHRLSGLIVDVFGESAVIASSAAWVEKHKPEIEAYICKVCDIKHVKWRPSVEILKEEGLDLSDLKETDPSTYPERTKVGNPFEHCILTLGY